MLKKIFAKQIAYDKKNNNENSTDFGKYIPYLTPKLQERLAVETGATYRRDIKEENDDWFNENDPEDMDKDYQNWLKAHQSHFKLNCIYPFADDIDDRPSPLTHKQFWMYLNGDADVAI